MSEQSGGLPSFPSRREAIASFREAGGRIAALFPVHVPRALFRAFGLLPVEVWGPPGRDTSAGDSRLQAYTCSVVRSGLAFMQTGGLEVADVVLVPHACDSLQGLGSVLLDFVKPDKLVAPFYMPRDDGPAGVTFLAAEVRVLRRRLGEYLEIEPTDEELHAAIDREEEADGLLGELLDARPNLPWSDAELYGLLQARQYLPAERFSEVARAALKSRGDAPRAGTRIVLSGMVAEPVSMLQALDSAGAWVAGDDLAATGRRRYPATTAEDPAERIARSLMGSRPGSTRGSSVADRAAHLAELAQRTGSVGVLFWVVKFCEPDLFYLPQLRRELDGLGLKSAVIEFDISDPLPGGAVTRLEAFLEVAS
jgi:benzoyl-CoA reductase/2-hydroxyglutaryl-CoA dehydratase subunit BcrC/BadD/HgdB